MIWCIPLSTKQKEFDFYYNFTDPLHRKVSAILAQMKLLSVQRLKRRLYQLDQINYGTIIERIKGFL